MPTRDPFLNPTRLAIGVGLATIVLLVVAASTSTTAFGIYNTAWDGASEVQEVAQEAEASTTIARETTAYPRTDANGTVGLILSPDQPYTPRERQHLTTFVRNGGTLVVAADYDTNANTLLRQLGAEARLDGRPLRDEQVSHRSPAMPVARNVTPQSFVTNDTALTLNHGTVIRPNNSTVLVRTSDYAYLDTNRNESLDPSEPVASYPVTTTEPRGQGRIIVISDASIFINVMLDRAGNRAFAQALFAPHDQVILDYSHTARLPPLALALLILRDIPLVQALIGVGGTLTILVLSRTDGVTRLMRRLRSPTAGDSSTASTESALTAYLRTRHPEWDEDRIQRIVVSRRDSPDAVSEEER